MKILNCRAIKMYKQKVQKLNRIAIPKQMAETLHIKSGANIYLAADDDRIYLAKRKDKLPRMMALFESSSTSLVGALPSPKTSRPLAVNYTDLEHGKKLAQKTIVLCQCGNEIVLEKGHMVDHKGAPLCDACSVRILHKK